MSPSALDSSQLRSRLKLKSLQSESILRAHHPQAISFLDKAGLRPGQLRNYAAKLLTTGAATTTLLITPPMGISAEAILPPGSEVRPFSPIQLEDQIRDQLKNVLPTEVVNLNSQQEDSITKILHDLYGIHASAELEGNRLNRSYGLIGAEQHLPRFPGDTAAMHGTLVEKGITPGRGAWGYFAYSQSQLSPDLIDKEKYYVAVQTLYLPDWTTRLAYLRDWYKYRKVIVVNPVNGRSVVAVVADSGPAAWTGKHYGGSPEIMAYLKLNVGKQKGPVVLFFVDDPQDTVPLGPLEFNLEHPPLLLGA